MLQSYQTSWTEKLFQNGLTDLERFAVKLYLFYYTYYVLFVSIIIGTSWSYIFCDNCVIWNKRTIYGFRARHLSYYWLLPTFKVAFLFYSIFSKLS